MSHGASYHIFGTYSCCPLGAAHDPVEVLLTFLLVAQSLASSVSTMSAQGRPVTDTRNDAAVEFVSTRTLPFVMISFANFHPRLFPPPPAPVCSS